MKSQKDATVEAISRIIKNNKNATFSKNDIPVAGSSVNHVLRELRRTKKIKLVELVKCEKTKNSMYIYQGIKGDKKAIEEVVFSPEYTTLTEFLSRYHHQYTSLIKEQIPQNKLPQYITCINGVSAIVYLKRDLERVASKFDLFKKETIESSNTVKTKEKSCKQILRDECTQDNSSSPMNTQEQYTFNLFGFEIRVRKRVKNTISGSGKGMIRF